MDHQLLENRHVQLESAIVTSCESESDTAAADDHHGDDSSENVDQQQNTDLIAGSTANDLYDEDQDAADEAYVYQKLRGGVKESVLVRQNDTLKPMQMYKPRLSDAVLSCPCCFKIVCMDCQRHERYSNQYRAMFVMNIVVDWSKRLIYDAAEKGLIIYEGLAENQKIQEIQDNNLVIDTIYYAVCCDSCTTQVAVLDLEEEIYHFSGCMAS